MCDLSIVLAVSGQTKIIKDKDMNDLVVVSLTHDLESSLQSSVQVHQQPGF